MVRGLGLRDLGLFLRGDMGKVIVTYNYWKGSYKGSRDELFFVMAEGKTGGNGHKL